MSRIARNKIFVCESHCVYERRDGSNGVDVSKRGFKKSVWRLGFWRWEVVEVVDGGASRRRQRRRLMRAEGIERRGK